MDIMPETFKAGQFIFLEGDKSAHFYIIQEGKVEIFTNSAKDYFKIAEMGPGESFGEFALLNRSPRSASARAVTDVSVVKVSERGYEQMLNELPGWASCMMASFVKRLRMMNERLLEAPQFLTRN
jgi:CRP/FNR family transcriptional regulator, cyclic AMP receptor protein